MTADKSTIPMDGNEATPDKYQSPMLKAYFSDCFNKYFHP